MEKDTIIIIVIAICVSLVLFVFAVLMQSKGNFEHSPIYQATIIGCAFMALVACSFIVRYFENKRVEVLIKDKCDWTYYMDGKEVSYENIDVSNYNISFNEEEQKVFLTRKDDKKITFFPVIIP